MSQSPDGVAQRFMAMMTSKTAGERLRMASSMFATARTLIRAGEPESHGDLRARLFTRLYGRDFSADDRERIITHLGRSRIE